MRIEQVTLPSHPFYPRVYDVVITGGKNNGKPQGLAGDIVRNREKVDLPKGNTNVFGLTPRESSSEIGVSEKPALRPPSQ